MKEPTKNIPASIRARLKNEAEQLGRPFAEILQYYAMERFLYRLSRTKYAQKFVLKGGLLFYVWGISLRRPTRDIDFRGYVTNNLESLLQIFRGIADLSVPEDGISFDSASVSVEETQEDADYQGVRTKLIAHLGSSRIPLQIDIGFSDEIAVKVEALEYPSILPEAEQVHLKGYPKAVVLAEKFHAMVRYAELNSRLKDFYDIWLIAEMFEMDGLSVQKAIETTFKKREMEIPAQKPVAFSMEFASTNQTRWVNFLGRMGLENAAENDFAIILERIWAFLEHPLNTLHREEEAYLVWTPDRGWH